jgi:hypothetical protein
VVASSVVTGIHQSIASLARRVHSSTVVDKDAVLREVVAIAMDIPGAQYAAITLVSRQHEARTVGHTHSHAADLGAIEAFYHQGPSWDSAWSQQLVHVDDLDADDRWTDYRREALVTTPIRSIVSHGFFVEENSLAALTVYARAPHALGDEANGLCAVLTTHVSVSLDAVRLRRHFDDELADRDVVGQAVGIVMERFGIGSEEAYELLRRIARTNQKALTSVAREFHRTAQS